jgi:hypothetical protein
VPPDAVNVVDFPEQIELVAAVAVIVGMGLTVMLIDAELTQPLASVPETVYVVLDVGLAVTDEPDVAERPVPGDQI